MITMNRVLRGLLAPVLIAAGLVATTAATSTATATPAHAASSTPSLAWQLKTSGRLHQSAPVIADLNGDGIPEIIVGDLNGLVHAYEPNGHGELAGWPQYARPDGVHPTAVESSPAVADLFNNGQKEVIVGATSVWVPNQQGGLVVFDAHGRTLWHWQGIDYITIWGQTSFHHDGYTEGAIDTPAIGDVDGDGYPDIVFGGLDARIHALNRYGHELAGFPVQADDTVWSSPALYDVFHSGQDEIFIGSPSTGGGPQPQMCTAASTRCGDRTSRSRSTRHPRSQRSTAAWPRSPPPDGRSTTPSSKTSLRGISTTAAPCPDTRSTPDRRWRPAWPSAT
jgi:hypothetical protein